jgi:hypothetical protein
VIYGLGTEAGPFALLFPFIPAGGGVELVGEVTSSAMLNIANRRLMEMRSNRRLSFELF